MTIQDLKDRQLIVLECISGSHAYGLNLPTSDQDIKGVFILPEDDFYGLDYVAQVSDERNDHVYYELRRFVELLAKNNPNVLELLDTPQDCLLYRHPLMDLLPASLFLSRLCKETFAGYAMSQVRKAHGLNKKIVNPIPRERKSVLHFCYVPANQGSMPLLDWLEKNEMQQEKCGLVNVPNMRDMYGLYYDANNEYDFKGIVRDRTTDMVLLSSIPKDLKPATLLHFNKDGYKVYCKEYREYWEWVELRNEARYENTISSGKNYDAKNMMHTFRLLDMATEILRDGQIIVRRPNREELLGIRKGEFTYEELMLRANEKIAVIENLYSSSPLPETPNISDIQRVLIQVRKQFYGR